jgi:membrane protein implicated in regulation of membrane protease activity
MLNVFLKGPSLMHWLTQTTTGFVFALVIGIILLLVLYLLPVILAYSLGSSYAKGILILNLTLGWTILGWLAALIWAILSGNGGSFDEPAGDDSPTRQQNTERRGPTL